MMPTIYDLPLAGKIKGHFEKFFEDTDSEATDWSMGDFNKILIHNVQNPLSPMQDRCAVCGHRLIWGAQFGSDDKDDITVGRVCASNLIALSKYNNDISQMNFDREVELQKRTMNKRMKEAKQREKVIQLEIQFSDELYYCQQMIEQLKKEFPKVKESAEKFETTFIHEFSRTYGMTYRNKVKLFSQFLYWTDEGREYFEIEDLQKAIKSKTVEERIAEIKAEVIREQKRQKRMAEIETTNKEYERRITTLKNGVRLGKYDVNFVESLFSWFEDKKYQPFGMTNREIFTDKQAKSVDRLWHKYRGQLQSMGVEFDSRNDETWGDE